MPEQSGSSVDPMFSENQAVRVKLESPGSTRRTPHYIRGKTGVILKSHGVVTGYEHDHKDFRGPMYSVIFDSSEVFGTSSNQKVVLDLHEAWLEPAGGR